MASAEEYHYQFTIHPRLSDFPRLRQDLLSAYPDITDTIRGALIFSRKPLSALTAHLPPPRVLLLKRSSSLPDGQWPGGWDFPGGRFETSDADVFDAVAREVKEDTGLAVSQFTAFAGLTTWTKGPEYGDRKWGKFCFIINVEETVAADDLQSVLVRCNPGEHDAWTWVTAEELDGYTFLGIDGEQVIKEGFWRPEGPRAGFRPRC